MSWLIILQILGMLIMAGGLVAVVLWLASPKVKKDMEDDAQIPFKDDDIKGD